MKKATKQIYLLIIVFGLTLIWTNFIVDDNAYFYNYCNSSQDCTDSSNTYEHCHSVCFGHDFFMNDSKAKLIYGSNSNDVVSVFNITFTSSFNADIWHPPKSS